MRGDGDGILGGGKRSESSLKVRQKWLKRKEKWLVVLGVVLHAVYMLSIFDIYFKTPIVHGMKPVTPRFTSPAKRLVLLVGNSCMPPARQFIPNKTSLLVLPCLFVHYWWFFRFSTSDVYIGIHGKLLLQRMAWGQTSFSSLIQMAISGGRFWGVWLKNEVGGEFPMLVLLQNLGLGMWLLLLAFMRIQALSPKVGFVMLVLLYTMLVVHSCTSLGDCLLKTDDSMSLIGRVESKSSWIWFSI